MIKKRATKKNMTRKTKVRLLAGVFILINSFNVSIGFSFWDNLQREIDSTLIRVGVGSRTVIESISTNYTEGNQLIAQDLPQHEESNINTAISSRYSIDIFNMLTSETIQPNTSIGVLEDWFIEIRIFNFQVINDNEDVTDEASSAIQFSIDFIQNAQTDVGTLILASQFVENQWFQSHLIINQGVYTATDFDVNLSITDLYTDAHSTALNQSVISYDMECLITQSPRT
jgi:hypothetical protein